MLSFGCWWCLMVIIGSWTLAAGAEPVSDEKRLIKHLMDNYIAIGKVGRPVVTQGETSRVEFGLQLIQILDLDEKNQVLTTNVWCKYKWLDHYLMWNREDYGGISKIRIPIQFIWKPDILLYNYVGERYTEQSDAMAVITWDGNVTWMPPAILKSTCEIDATIFPFDEQLCTMKFGSWTYSRNALDPYFYGGQDYITLDDYVPSNEWTILEHSGQKNIKFYDCCPDDSFPDLTFRLKLHRKATFYNYILILPSVLLSVMPMVMFLLPPESPAKLSLGVNIIAAFFLLLLLLKDATPTASHRIPLIGAYYCFNMIVTTVSTFLCALVANLHFGADKRDPPPAFLKKFVVNVLAPGLCIRVQKPPKKPQQPVLKQTNNYSASAEPERKRLIVANYYTKNNNNNSRSATPVLSYHRPRLPSLPASMSQFIEAGGSDRYSTLPRSLLLANNPAGPETPFEKTNKAIEFSAEMAELREIKNLIMQTIQKTQAKEHSLKAAGDWRLITRVIDRIFFFLYVAVMFISLAAFSLQPLEELSMGHQNYEDAGAAALNNNTNIELEDQ